MDESDVQHDVNSIRNGSSNNINAGSGKRKLLKLLRIPERGGRCGLEAPRARPDIQR